MFQNLKLRTKLVAIVTPPLFVLAVVAAYAVLLSNGSTSPEELSSDVRTLGVVALAAFLLSALAVVVIGRTISDPIDNVSASARELADVRLPALLDTLRHPGRPTPSFEPLVAGSNDEVSELVDSLNAVQVGIAGLAEEQRTMVRQGLSDLVVNLARRNQSLLDRQIEVIDRLEHEEEDPDQLQELFNLDHLATRMRRNAESLLVVAGAEPARRRGGPVEVADALRVAMSEIEDYRHVKLVNVEDAKIGAQSAVDLAHLFSELLENATQFSPPESPVEVTGVRHPDGSYLISCVDHGIGMTTDQLASANDVLQNPPELGLGLTRSLGFIVIGRLAARLGVQIELTHTPNGGITAIADIPSAVLSGSNLPTSDAGDHAPVVEQLEAPAEPEMYEAPSAAPAPPMPAPEQPGMAAAAFSLDDDGEAWTPPAMPARDANAFGAAPDSTPDFPPTESLSPIDPSAPAFGDSAPIQEIPAPPAPAAAVPEAFAPPAAVPEAFAPPADVPEAFAPPAAAPPMPDAHVADGAHLSSPETPASEALAKLLGVAPANFDAPPEAPAPTQPAPDSSNFFARPTEGAPAPESETPWQAPVFNSEAPAKLSEAIPSGQSFDSGMESLLDTDAGRTSAGLVKRDRTKNHAPESEGRRVASSVRSPDEIRSMLSRYRSGLKGKPLEDMATPPMPESPSNTFDSNGDI